MKKFHVIVRLMDMNHADTGKREVIAVDGKHEADALDAAKPQIFQLVEAAMERYETIEIADVKEIE